MGQRGKTDLQNNLKQRMDVQLLTAERQPLFPVEVKLGPIWWEV